MIGFVILHYQNINETIGCVESIKKNVREYKIVIVDNASPNGSGIELEKMYKNDGHVIIVLNHENVGFARGNNAGYCLLKEESPFVVVLNSDVELCQADFEVRIKKSFELYNFDILGPDIYSTKKKYHQNPQQLRNFTKKELLQRRRKLELKNRLKIFVRVKWLLFAKWANNNNEIEQDWTSPLQNVPLHGACYVFSSRYLVNHEKFFYDETFMYYESYIMHYLAQKESLKLVYDPEIKVIHHEDASTDCSYRIGEKAVFENYYHLDSIKKYLKLIDDLGEIDNVKCTGTTST